ncbi:NAD-dependent epimerase/dehydratase family protein [Nitrospira moscoviensis]|uniref:Putative NAD-dependent epimerase/dehydratase n=1 Tax=Nitrospira moscoviensis TaxID=42253 RepID=A0A0K2GFZ6_NITMO|nr:NAD-dependent epimerase/dehydratase family protein [Nitrospira moscoviensis]ALA59878.1 putative NAD-dependent epimerase/dehydratase [Nitrospira moscoviensis]
MAGRILVTGAAGFIGRNLVPAITHNGYTVRVYCHSALSYREDIGCEVICGDLRDPLAAKRAVEGCEAVVHLAGKAHAVDERSGNDGEYESINVEGTRYSLDAAAAAGVRRFIFASSVKVFGETTDGCVDESQAPAPQSAYAKSKWAAEQLVREYAGRYRFSGVSLRLPMVYGPTEKGNLFRMIEAIDRGRFPPLPRLSTVRSMLHVDNFTQAVVQLLQSDKPLKDCYIVTDAKPYNVTTIYEQLCAGLGKPVPARRVPLSLLKMGAIGGDIVQGVTRRPFPFTSTSLSKLIEPAWYSSQALANDVGYRPSLSFEDAVPELIAFYRRFTSRPRASA